MTATLRTAVQAAIAAVPQDLPTLRELCQKCGVTPSKQQRVNSQSLAELLQEHTRLLDTTPETVAMVRTALQKRTLDALSAAGKAAGVKGTTSQLETWLEKVEAAGIGKRQAPSAVSDATLAAMAAVTTPAPVDAQKPAAPVAQTPAAPTAAKPAPTAVYPTIYAADAAKLELGRLQNELGKATAAATAAAEVAVKAKREFERLDDVAKGLQAKVDALRATIAADEAKQPAAPTADQQLAAPAPTAEQLAKASAGTARNPKIDAHANNAPTNANTAATVVKAGSNATRKCHGKCKDGTSCQMNPVKGTDFCRHHAGQAKPVAPAAQKPVAPTSPVIPGLFVADGKGGFRPATETEVWNLLEASAKKAAA